MCFPDFCFSNRKACDLCSPENLSGDHRKHRGKCENSGFSPALQMAQFSLKISPGNEKADQRSGRRRIFKMVDHFFIFQKNSLHLKMANFSSLKIFYFPEKFSPPQNGEFFESQKEEHFHFSKNSPGETGTSFCLKKEFEHRENGRKEIRTSGLYT